MSEPAQSAITTTAGAVAISTSAISSMEVSGSLLSASVEQIIAGSYIVQLSDMTTIIAFVILLINTGINIGKYLTKNKD